MPLSAHSISNDDASLPNIPPQQGFIRLYDLPAEHHSG
jgi:hypothetical protein